MLFGGCEDALLLLVGSERDWVVGGNCNGAGGGGRAPGMVGRWQLGGGRVWVGKVRDWGGGGGLDLVSHRQEEVGADGKLGRQEVVAGRVVLGRWGRQGGSLPRRGSRGWGRSGQSTGPTFAFAPRQASKSSAQPIHHTGRQGRRLQGRGRLLFHEQYTDPSGELTHCQTPQCLCAAGRGSRWTGRGSLTRARPGLGSVRWLPPPSNQGEAPSASAPSRPEPSWPASATTAASLSSLPLRRGIANSSLLALPFPEKYEVLKSKGRGESLH